MNFQEEPDYATGIYRCSNSIKNLKIRVRLEKVKSSFITLPESNSSSGKTQSVEEEFEERLFSWQEKVFSSYELSRYEHFANCHTPVEQKYHKEVLRILRKDRPRYRLYTHTDVDEFSLTQEAHQKVIVGQAAKSFLEDSMANLRLRRGSGFKKIHRIDVNLPMRNVVQDSPSDDFKNESHLLTSTPQSMYILADLSVKESTVHNAFWQINKNNLVHIITHCSDGEWLNKCEYVLCTIRYYPDGVLQISPDFTKEKCLPYQIEVDSDSRIVYHYWIEHASNTGERERSKEKEIIEKLAKHYLDLRCANVGTTFEIPPLGLTEIYIMGEISLAEDFEYDSLFVHYILDIPKGWKANDPEKLSGTTQTSSSTVNHKGKDVVYFGNLFDVQLVVNHEEVTGEAESTHHKWPQLLLRVSSVDRWGRHRTEGYGHIQLPLHPGRHHLVVPTWRPLIHSPLGEMRRFFVGSSPEIEDLSYSGIPHSCTGQLMSRHGFHSASGGSVTIRYHIVTARNPNSTGLDELGLTDAFLFREENVQPSKAKSISAHSLFTSVDSVVSAFFKARARLKKIKEEIKEELVSSK